MKWKLNQTFSNKPQSFNVLNRTIDKFSPVCGPSKGKNSNIVCFKIQHLVIQCAVIPEKASNVKDTWPGEAFNYPFSCCFWLSKDIIFTLPKNFTGV